MRTSTRLALFVWVIAYETAIPENGKARLSYVKEGFRLKLLNRNLCIMYPEEKFACSPTTPATSSPTIPPPAPARPQPPPRKHTPLLSLSQYSQVC